MKLTKLLCFERGLMKKLLALILVAAALSAAASEITTHEYAQLFKNYDGCFILYDLNTHKILSEYNPNDHCNQQISPNSTFKVALSLMAFNEGLINQNTVFKWDGKKKGMIEWNQDQTPYRWLKYSVVWVSQKISLRLGYTRVKHYLSNFNYGNQDFSGDLGKNNGITHAWLSSSLKISAMEQLNFLNAMLSNQLLVTHEAVAHTKKNMYQGMLDNGAAYYGKTGSGWHSYSEKKASPEKLRDAWFIGFIEQGTRQYIFVSNLSDTVKPTTADGSLASDVLKPLTVQLLNDYTSRN